MMMLLCGFSCLVALIVFERCLADEMDPIDVGPNPLIAETMGDAWEPEATNPAIAGPIEA